MSEESGIYSSVPSEYIPGIDFGYNVVEGRIITIGDDKAGLLFKGRQVIDDSAAKEGGAVFQGRLIDDDADTFGLEALHDALDGRTAEVIRIILHGQAVDADDDFLFLVLTPGIIRLIGSGQFQNPVRNEVLAGTVAFHNGGHHVLGNILIVGEKLPGILRETVAAVAEGRIVKKLPMRGSRQTPRMISAVLSPLDSA